MEEENMRKKEKNEIKTVLAVLIVMLMCSAIFYTNTFFVQAHQIKYEKDDRNEPSPANQQTDTDTEGCQCGSNQDTISEDNTLTQSSLVERNEIKISKLTPASDSISIIQEKLPLATSTIPFYLEDNKIEKVSFSNENNFLKNDSNNTGNVSESIKTILFTNKNEENKLTDPYFWMDWAGAGTPTTINGGWFEGSEVWSSSKLQLSGVWNDPPINWTSTAGLYSAVRTDQDLSDGTTTKGAWCAAGQEIGPFIGTEDSRGWAMVQKSFNLNDYLSSDFLCFSNVTLYTDYKIASNDIDDGSSFVYFNMNLSGGGVEHPLQYAYKSGSSDAPSYTNGGWCINFWDPSYASPHGGNPYYPKNDNTIYNYVDHVSGTNQYLYPLSYLFNYYGSSWTQKIRTDVRLIGSSGGATERYNWWTDDDQYKCYYRQKPDLQVTSITLSPSTFCPGDAVEFRVTVTNNGPGYLYSGEWFYTRLYFDDVYQGSWNCTEGFTAGQSRTYTASFYWVGDCASHSINAIADGSNRIPETNEDNNGKTSSFSSGCPALTIEPTSPTTYDFGNVCVGDSSQATFTIRNTGSCPATGYVELTGSYLTEFGITNDPNFSLSAGGTKVIYVVFHPTSAGLKTATLVANGDYPCPDANKAIKGTGCIPIIQLTPSQYPFGNIEVGKWSPLVSFTLTNIGCCHATGYVTKEGAYPDQYTINQSGGYFDLAASGGSITIKVRFHPTSTGDKPALLKATGQGYCNTVQSDLFGTGIILPANITLLPISHGYENTYIYNKSANYSFVLNNTGGQTATGYVSLGGTNDDQFNITQGGGSYSLQPHEVKTIKVRFEPTIPGYKTAYLNATLNTPPQTRISSLTGTALSTPPRKPTLTGSTYGYINVSTLHFNATTTDPDPGQYISYKFDWGDGTNSGWLDFVPSGTMVTITHGWNISGTKQVKVQAKDNYNTTSEWSNILNVVIYNVFLIPHYAVITGEWNYPGTTNDIPESYNNAFGIFTLINETNEWSRSNITYYNNRGSSGILSDLDWMRTQENDQSISLFYYSGHGAQIPDDNGDEQDGYDEALYCSDGNYIRDDTLNTTLNSFNGLIVVILESCNSGGMPSFWVPNGDDNGLLGELLGNNRIILSACGETQDSHTGGGFKSLFTNFIGKGWLGEADLSDPQHPLGDDQITAEETFTYASQHLVEWIQNHGNPFQQTPQLYDSIDGELPLIVSGFSANNTPPGIPSNPTPANGSTNISTQTTLSCLVTDPNNDAVSIAFYWKNTSTDILIGFTSPVNSGSYATITVTNLNPSTLYQWYVVVDDGINITYSPIWSFTTNATSTITQSYTLHAGHNLITVPVQNTLLASSLGGLIPGCQMVSRYDALNQSMVTHIVGIPVFDFPIINGVGYLIYTTTNCVFNITGYPIANLPMQAIWGQQFLGVKW